MKGAISMKQKAMLIMTVLGAMMLPTFASAAEYQPHTITSEATIPYFSMRSIPYQNTVTESDGDAVINFTVSNSFRFYIENQCDSNIVFKCYTPKGTLVGLPEDTVAPGKNYTSMWVAASRAKYKLVLMTEDGGDLKAYIRVREAET